jgi:hypothetical protein
MAWINVLGGTAVLGSYVHGLTSNPTTQGMLWGGVPEALQPLYTVSMFTAAAGYLVFTYILFRRVDPEQDRVGATLALRLFNTLYVGILVPSALWLPLTFAMLANPSETLWIGIRLTLFTVGAASIGVVVGLMRLRPRPAPVVFGLAVAGSLAFAFQTAVLDALIWSAFFPGP